MASSKRLTAGGVFRRLLGSLGLLDLSPSCPLSPFLPCPPPLSTTPFFPIVFQFPVFLLLRTLVYVLLGLGGVASGALVFLELLQHLVGFRCFWYAF